MGNPLDLKTTLKLQEKNKELTSELKKLKKLVGQKENFQEELLSAVKEKLICSPIIKPYKVVSNSKNIDERELVVVLTDLHYGTFVYPEEINGLNKFGWVEASRRTALVIKQAITFKNHNKFNRCHLVIGGDVLAGLVHNEKTKQIDLLIQQMNGSLHILSHAITALGNHFPEVIVHGIAGNHDRNPIKTGPGRAITEIYDSFVNNIYYSLSVIFQNNKHISFDFPKGIFIDLNLSGGRAAFCHGDLLFGASLGNPGKSLNIKGLSDALHRFNLGEIKKGKEPFKLVMFGHVHTSSSFISNDGVQVVVIPSLIGLDSFAHSLGINHSFASQLVFETTKNFIYGDSRLVDVAKADKNKELDKIIPVFNRSLKYEK